MRESGMTLIELLVAMFLLAILSVMSYRGLDAMARANDRVSMTTDRWEAISLFFERFTSDVSQPSNRMVRNGAGAPLPQLWGRPLLDAAGTDAQLEFTRKSVPGQDDVRVGYRLHAGVLELLIWPVLDRSPASVPQVYPLLENVTAMRLSYLDSQGRWTDYWPVTPINEALPRAVSLEITLTDQPAIHRIIALP